MKIKDKKKFIKVISIIAVILVLILIMIVGKNKNKTYNEIGDFKNVKEVLEYLGCTYIRDTSAKEENYSKNIYVKFNRNLYEKENSNERFFMNLIQMVTKVNKYRSVILTDQERNITIKILCDEANSSLITYYINDKENYFTSQDSNLSIDNIVKDNIVDLTINSNEIDRAIKTKWVEKDMKLGTVESEFEGYKIYADEGYKTKLVGNKVFNIVFDKNYTKSVVNNIKVGTSFDEIKSILGHPNFTESNEAKVIGYKGENLYVFFTEDEISIYKNDTTSSDEFLTNLEKFAKGEIDFQSYVDELTRIWPDYDEYAVTEDFYLLTYTLKGIEVKVTPENKDGVHVYRNYTGLSEKENLSELLETGKIHIHGDENLVFNKEVQRLIADDNREFAYLDCMNILDEDKPRSKLFYYQVMKNNDQIYKVSFLAVEENYISSELKENINSYVWFNDEIFLYGKAQDGIYAYDAVKREKRKLLSGTDNFEIKGIENNKLLYDDKSVQLN